MIEGQKQNICERPGEDIEANCRDLQYAAYASAAYAGVIHLCTLQDNSR